MQLVWCLLAHALQIEVDNLAPVLQKRESTMTIREMSEAT